MMVTAISVCAADYEAILKMSDEDRSAWVKSKIPPGCTYEDPMPILAGGLWDVTIPVVGGAEMHREDGFRYGKDES